MNIRYTNRNAALPTLTRRMLIGCAVSLAAFSSSLVAADKRADDPLATLVAAERTFAEDAARMGITSAFRTHAAPDSILLRPDPKPALAQLAEEKDVPGLRLEWRPAMAAVSRSNDLGFTTGPYRMLRPGSALHGQFLTVWLRGDDGRWRWYLDHGLPPIPEEQPTTFPSEVQFLAAGTATVAADSARSELVDAEDKLNAAIVRGDWGVLIDALAPEGKVLRVRHGVLSPADAARLLPTLKGFEGSERFDMRVAGAGDLAASYGRLRRAEGKPSASYVRIWRRDAAGWRLLIDQVT